MTEAYTVGLNEWVHIGPLDEEGQVFTPRADHILEFIDLQLQVSILWFPNPLEVYKCDSSGQPIGDRISWSTSYTFQKQIIIVPQRVRFRMHETPLTAGQRYLIVLKFRLPLPPGVDWGNDKDDQTYYDRGWRMSHIIGAPTWTQHVDECHIFAEFGTPPLPKPEPPPPIDNFAIPDIAYCHWDVGLTIVLPTTVPCHLTCHYTDKQPLKHDRSRIVRGLNTPSGTYFCFVAWKTVEQTEPGDTLYHTFEFNEWPSCAPPPATIPFNLLKDIAPLWEPWGTTLRENYHWLILADPDPPIITFDKSIITLDLTGTPHSGILWRPLSDYIRLQDTWDQPLHLLINNPEVHSVNPADHITNAVIIHKGAHYINLYFPIKATLLGPFSTPYGYGSEPAYDYAWWYLGPGTHDVNLLDRFQQLAKDLDIDPNPTGWFVDTVEIAHRDLLPIFHSHIKNDYFCLYHPIPYQKGGRWFTFIGEVDLQNVPSVGPIFQHCHPGGWPRQVILRPNAPGEYCTIPGGVPLFCPDHWDNVNEEIPDEDESYVVHDRYLTSHAADFYSLPNLDPADPYPWAEVVITARLRYSKGFAYATHALTTIKTHDSGYNSGDWGPLWPTYKDYDWHLPLNPFTNEPWTTAELNELQIGVELYSYAGVGWWTDSRCTQLYAIAHHKCEPYF